MRLHGNSGYANAPQCVVYTYIACVFPFLLLMSIFLDLLPPYFCLLYILLCLHDVSVRIYEYAT